MTKRRGRCDLLSQVPRVDFCLRLHQCCQHRDAKRCGDEAHDSRKRGRLSELARVNIRQGRNAERLDNQTERKATYDEEDLKPPVPRRKRQQDQPWNDHHAHAEAIDHSPPNKRCNE